MLLSVITGPSTKTLAQSVSYNDVLVVINEASEISDSVGEYFANVRYIPIKNIVRVTTQTTEEIDSVQFHNLRQQIESALITRNIEDSINYIVTTKGMPLKVIRRGSLSSSSVESDLSLILGPYASSIGGSGKIASPYYTKHDNFTRSKYGFYLVTRLDGYSYNDIKGLIDRASIISTSIPSNAQVVLDMDPMWTSTPTLNINMQRAADSLKSKGITSYLDTTTTFVTDKINVLGYTSFGSNDHNCESVTTHAIPRNTYLPGAIAETYVSTSARSFTLPPLYGQSLIADLIAEGITAVKGYVYEPYSNAMANVSVLFSMYADGFTIAESFYSASHFLSWMDVIIGDPKFRLIGAITQPDTANSQGGGPSELSVELISFTTIVTKNNVTLNWKTATEIHCYGFEVEKRRIGDWRLEMEDSNPKSQISNPQWSKIGFVHGSGTSNTSHKYSFIDLNPAPGQYAYRLKQIDDDGSFNYYGNSEIHIVQPNKKLILNDNYPNPFNPSTTINFKVAHDGPAMLYVYNILGQRVATLFDQLASAGQNYQVMFEGSTFPSGIYFAKLESNNQSIVKRMVLAK